MSWKTLQPRDHLRNTNTCIIALSYLVLKVFLRKENIAHINQGGPNANKWLISYRFKRNKHRGWPLLGENSKLASNTRVECNMKEPKVQDQEWRRRQVTWSQVGQMFFLLVVFCLSCSNIIDTLHQYITMVLTRIHSLFESKLSLFDF